MTLVLLDRRWNALPVVEIDSLPAPVGIPNLAAKALALDHVNFQEAINQQVVDLRDAPVPLQSQVVDDSPVAGVFQVEVNMVGGFLFALQPGTTDRQILLQALPFTVRKRLRQGQLHFLELDLYGIFFLQDHVCLNSCVLRAASWIAGAARPGKGRLRVFSSLIRIHREMVSRAAVACLATARFLKDWGLRPVLESKTSSAVCAMVVKSLRLR